MAKKVAKKVAKKKATRKKPEGITEAESKMADVVDNLSDEEAQDIIEARDVAPKAIEDKVKPGDRDPEDLVKVRIPVHLKIKGKMLNPGIHQVPRHQLPTIMEMIHRKRRADLSVFTGKNFLIERLMDRTLVIKETSDELNLRKMTK